MTPLRLIRLGTWLLVAVLLGATGYVVWTATAPQGGVVSSGTPAIGGPFTLTDQDGKPVTEASFAGRPHAVFFGYTHCPDVCPTTLNDLSVVLGEMGEDATKLDIWFVTVDPERDTAPVLKDYLSAFGVKVRGLTGTEQQVADMTTAYKVYRRKVPGTDPDDYAMDHTAAVYLFGAAGDFRGTISYGEAEADTLAKLKRLVAS